MGYPNDHVFIAKIRNQKYLAYVLNNTGDRVKMLDTYSVIPYENRYSYIYEHYGVPRPICEWNMSSLRSEIRNKIGSAPSTNMDDYVSENEEDSYSSWRVRHMANSRIKKAQNEYEDRKNKYPSFNDKYNVEEYEISSVIDYLASQESPSSSGGYDYSSLDF